MSRNVLHLPLLLLLALAAACGCTINKSRMATEQLVVSDAVDRVVAQVDFSPLSGQKVYFDTKYLAGAKLAGNPNVEYLTSSLRQQMLAYDCRLTDKLEEADLVVEARVGALGNDGNEATYGIPGSAAAGAATAIATGFPVGGTLPELSVGRRNHQWGAAKIGLFAYDRVSHQRIWQAGVSTGASQAREMWVLGIGPFQQGRVYKEAKASMNERPRIVKDDRRLHQLDPLEAYGASIDFQGEPKRLAAPSPSAPRASPVNPQNSQVLPASGTAPP
ncbi:MAG: DUF6655 family protein [Pirellulaceae bacterium]